MQLVVGTESTWSLRTWMCTQLANIEVTEQVVDLTTPEYKSVILAFSPSGLVPALITEQGVIHDSLAIIEFLNECADGALYPTSIYPRAIARSLCAEMHAGFMGVRSQFPFTLPLPDGGTLMKTPLKTNVREQLSHNVQDDLTRIEAIFTQAKQPFMFDGAGAVDAFYAILAFRLQHYGITFEGRAGEYQQSLLQWPLLQAAIDKAKAWRHS